MQSCNTFINCLATLYQFFINVFINFLSTVYQLFINFLSTFYQLLINFLSTVYQCFVNFLSTVHQHLLSTLDPHVINFQLFIRVHLQESISLSLWPRSSVIALDVRGVSRHALPMPSLQPNIPQHTVRISVSSVAQHCCGFLHSTLFGSKCTAIQFCMFKWPTIIPKYICE